MAELIGEENIDWSDFSVTDPDAREFEGEDVQTDPAQADTSEDVSIAPEDTVQEGRPAETEDQPEDRLWAGKYRSPEEAERAWQEAQSLVGRRDEHREELQAQNERLLAILEQQQQQQQPQFMPDLDTLFAEDPVLAADATLNNADMHKRVKDQWREIDPAQVSLYENQKRIEYRQAMQDQEFQKTQQALQQATQVDPQVAISAAASRLNEEFPDIDLQQLAPAMVQEAEETRAATGRSVYADMLESGDPNAVYHGLRTLALTAINRQGAEVRSRVAENARTAAAESQRAKTEAMVTSATGTAPEPDAPKTYDDELLESFKSEDTRRDGFHIGSY